MKQGAGSWGMDPMARWPGAEWTRWHVGQEQNGLDGTGRAGFTMAGASWIHNGRGRAGFTMDLMARTPRM